MLTKAQNHIDNHTVKTDIINQQLRTFSWIKRAWFPFFYVLSRSIRQTYVRGVMAEATYLFAYFLLGTCLGYLFSNKQQAACDIQFLPTLYFLISLAFGILTCISSQRLFGVETTDRTFERESRNYFHPFQYWLAKSLVDNIRLLLYPLLFLSMLYIEVVPRGLFSYYYGIMVLLSFVCTGIGQLTSVIFNRTEYAYLGGTIIALLSCLLSGFSPTKRDLGRGGFIVDITFSRHVQHLLFRHEAALFIKGADKGFHIWSLPVESIREYYSFSDGERPLFWLIFLGIVLRFLTFLFLYGKSEYRSKIRVYITNIVPSMKRLFGCKPCRERSSQKNNIRKDDCAQEMNSAL